MSHPDTISGVADELGMTTSQVQRLVTTLIHTRGFSRVVAEDNLDPADVQLTTEAAGHLRQMYSQGLLGRRPEVSA